MKIFATENSIREFLREAMSGAGVGWPYAADMSEKPIGANPVVDPSAAVTDPDNQKFKPRNRTEFKIAVQSLVDDTADGDAPTLYDAVFDALQGFTKDEDEMKNKGVGNSGNKVEETVRQNIKKMLAEMYGKVNEAQAWRVSYNIPNKRGRAQPEKFVRTFTTEVEARAEAASAERRYGDINDVVTIEPVEMTDQELAQRAGPQVTKIPASTSQKREREIAALRQHLEKSSIDAEVEATKTMIMKSDSGDPLIEDIKKDLDALESLAYALKEIDNSAAIRYAKCFNETKNELLLFKTEAELDVDEPEEMQGGVGEKGGQFELDGEEIDEEKIAKISADYALFEKYGDRSIMSTKTFKELWGDGFDTFIYNIGNTVKQAMAARVGEKRTYLKDKVKTSKQISDVMGFSQALVNKIVHQSLGKYALGIKAAVAGHPLNVDADNVDADKIPSAVDKSVHESIAAKSSFLTLKEHYALKNKRNK